MRRVLCACALAFSGVTGQAQALGDAAAAKAKLVATLARFVQWPSAAFASESAALRICVFASSPAVQRAFESLPQGSVGGRPVQALINPGVVAKNCHVLFFDESGGSHADRVLKNLAAEPAFTVGTQDGFVSDGGMVEIVQVDNALRFDFNLPALHDAGLGINPGVLKLARQVRQ